MSVANAQVYGSPGDPNAMRNVHSVFSDIRRQLEDERIQKVRDVHNEALRQIKDIYRGDVAAFAQMNPDLYNQWTKLTGIVPSPGPITPEGQMVIDRNAALNKFKTGGLQPPQYVPSPDTIPADVPQSTTPQESSPSAIVNVPPQVSPSVPQGNTGGVTNTPSQPQGAPTSAEIEFKTIKDALRELTKIHIKEKGYLGKEYLADAGRLLRNFPEEEVYGIIRNVVNELGYNRQAQYEEPYAYTPSTQPIITSTNPDDRFFNRNTSTPQSSTQPNSAAQSISGPGIPGVAVNSLIDRKNDLEGALNVLKAQQTELTKKSLDQNQKNPTAVLNELDKVSAAIKNTEAQLKQVNELLGPQKTQTSAAPAPATATSAPSVKTPQDAKVEETKVKIDEKTTDLQNKTAAPPTKEAINGSRKDLAELSKEIKKIPKDNVQRAWWDDKDMVNNLFAQFARTRTVENINDPGRVFFDTMFQKEARSDMELRQADVELKRLNALTSILLDDKVREAMLKKAREEANMMEQELQLKKDQIELAKKTALWNAALAFIEMDFRERASKSGIDPAKAAEIMGNLAKSHKESSGDMKKAIEALMASFMGSLGYDVKPTEPGALVRFWNFLVGGGGNEIAPNQSYRVPQIPPPTIDLQNMFTGIWGNNPTSFLDSLIQGTAPRSNRTPEQIKEDLYNQAKGSGSKYGR